MSGVLLLIPVLWPNFFLAFPQFFVKLPGLVASAFLHFFTDFDGVPDFGDDVVLFDLEALDLELFEDFPDLEELVVELLTWLVE